MKPPTIARGRPVDCWDWPELTVCNFQKGGALCSETTEPKPNEYLVQRSGRSHLTVIRTHKFLNHLLSSVALDHKVQAGDRQPLFYYTDDRKKI